MKPQWHLDKANEMFVTSRKKAAKEESESEAEGVTWNLKLCSQ